MPYFNFSNVLKCFNTQTKFQVHIICSSRKKMDGVGVLFCKFQSKFKLYFSDIYNMDSFCKNILILAN